MSQSPSLRLLDSLWHLGLKLLLDPQYFVVLAGLVVLGDACLTQLIIRFISYTEIDWETYMYQLELYLKGERDYALISGPTGPIVYPAGHVYVHQILYYLTDGGQDMWRAQQIYGALYIAGLFLTTAIYHKAGNLPNWILLLLPLSKRLHSIYALRLFNDCWAVLASQAAVLAFVSSWDATGILLLGCALSVKMNALLYVPGLLVVLFQRRGAARTLALALLLALTQAGAGLPFLRAHPRSYLGHAYEFSRVFLFKWTVNWRFLGEDLFLDRRWAGGSSRAIWDARPVRVVRWCRREGGAWRVVSRGLLSPLSAPAKLCLIVLASDVVTVLFTSNLIGIVFARSLHYQFYSWYATQLPFLCWRTKYPVPVLLLAIEYAWNTFPSTNLSSGTLLAAHLLLLAGIWFGYSEGKVATAVPTHSGRSEKVE
ncbi:mannosyltransferase [Epithele typhae]|uniref:mannosyltransferase n=1 Tax=Epithele typhae TaxID=378194 RepID=UPI0020082472|nr:mannosyltransferase [Epithele typhae]KAH9945986.1 mannosyltransferase [Epithele typhae]